MSSGVAVAAEMRRAEESRSDNELKSDRALEQSNEVKSFHNKCQ